MREASRSWILPLSLLSISLVCASFIQFLTPRLNNVAIDDGRRRLENVPFPFITETSEPTEEYRITADIDHRPYQFASFRVLPTLCLTSLKINDQSLAFPSGHCDYITGYDVPLPAGPEATRSQLIHLDATVSTSFPIFGMSTRAPATQPIARTLRLIAIAALAGALYLALRAWGFSRSISLILLASLPIQLRYLSHTPVIERTYDVLGHMQHIEFIAYHSSLPPSDYCHECYQPSLYYAAAAGVYSIARAAHIFDPMLVLQFFSLAWFWLFLVMSTRIVLLFLPGKLETHLATALLSFWPGGFLHSARVSNDIPFYAFFATCLYFTLSWWKTGSRKHLAIAAMVAGCGVLIKGTMTILVGAIGILLLYRFMMERRDGKPRSSWASALLVMAAGIAAYIAQSFLKGGTFLPTWRLWPSMYVGNSWKQYLLLNASAYFQSPFVDSVKAGTGREYFWNYLLKSSMFGDYSDWFHKPIERFLALVMGPLLLALAAFFWIGLARNLRRSTLHSLPVVVVITLSFMAIFLHRFANPYSANNDFRFIYPVLIPIVLMIVEGTRNSRMGQVLCFLFCAFSAAFYLTV